MAQIPEIRPEINKEPERKGKGAGLLARLFGGGSGSGGVAAGGGMLATKTGLLTLILAGSTVAGGIGVVGYRLFGPGQESGGGDNNLQLFAPKPKEAASPDVQAAPKDGSSKSLNFLAQGNAPAKPAETPAAAPDAAAPSADAAASATASAGASGTINEDSASVRKMPLKNSGKFGEMKRNFGGGGSAVTASAAAPSKPAQADAVAAARPGAKGAALKHGAGSAFGQSRAVAGKRENHALHQAIASFKEGSAARSSYAAGHTFDGSKAQKLDIIGPGGTDISMTGPGATGSMPTNIDKPNKPNDKKDLQANPPAPPPSVEQKVPWKHAIDEARMLIAAALVLVLLAFALSASIHGRFIKRWIGVIVGLIGLAVIALGAQVAGGAYGQKLQGGLLTAAGIGLAVMGSFLAASNWSDSEAPQGAVTSGGEKQATSTAYGSDGMPLHQAGTAGASAAPTSTLGAMMSTTGGFWIIMGGGTALLALAGSMLKPPEKHPSSNFNNGNPPDSHWFGYRQAPSETALKKLIA